MTDKQAKEIALGRNKRLEKSAYSKVRNRRKNHTKMYGRGWCGGIYLLKDKLLPHDRRYILCGLYSEISHLTIDEVHTILEGGEIESDGTNKASLMLLERHEDYLVMPKAAWNCACRFCRERSAYNEVNALAETAGMFVYQHHGKYDICFHRSMSGPEHLATDCETVEQCRELILKHKAQKEAAERMKRQVRRSGTYNQEGGQQ